MVKFKSSSSARRLANSASVTPADPGYYTIPEIEDKSSLREDQVICPRGFACNGGDKVGCSGEGEYTDEEGLKACLLAPAGKIPNAARSGVESCQPGTYSIGGQSECSPCDSNMFSSEG